MESYIVDLFYGKEENNEQYGMTFYFYSLKEAKRFIVLATKNTKCNSILHIKHIDDKDR